MDNKSLSELDAFCAEFVMGWKRTEEPDKPTLSNETLFWHRKEPRKPEAVLFGEPYEMRFERGSLFSHSWKTFSPTTDPDAAMMVLKVCIEKIGWERIISMGTTSDGEYFMNHSDADPSAESFCNTSADTMPLLICRFAKALYAK